MNRRPHLTGFPPPAGMVAARAALDALEPVTPIDPHPGLCDRARDDKSLWGGLVCRHCGWARRHHRPKES